MTFVIKLWFSDVRGMATLLDENWLPIAQAPNYEISDLGRVRPVVDILKANRYRSYVFRPAGVPLVPRPSRGSRSYPHVNLRYADKTHEVAVCRTVWETFRGPLNKQETVAFRDGDSGNAALANLRIVPALHVAADRVTVMRIREAYAGGMLTGKIAQEFGLPSTVVSNIVRGNTWKHLPVLPPRCLVCGDAITRRGCGRKRYCGPECLTAASVVRHRAYRRQITRERVARFARPQSAPDGPSMRKPHELWPLVKGYSQTGLARAAGISRWTACRLIRQEDVLIQRATFNVVKSLEQGVAAGD